MNDDIVILAPWQVGVAYIFVIIVLTILKHRGIKREKVLLYGTLRMSVQLILVGFILTWIIENPHPLITVFIVLVMVSFAALTVMRKFKETMSKPLARVVTLSLFVGTLPVLLFFFAVVIGIRPIYDPQYVIPITGMIVGNSMTGISLGVHTLLTRFTKGKAEIEEALILGATPKDASKPIVDDAFDAAIMPTLNSMLGMGIIFLPGMMTGQILSGVDPSLAISYQIAIMLGILGGVSLTTYAFLQWGYKTFFNREAQLIA